MTLNEAIYELREIIRRGNLYDDDNLDDRLLKHWLHNQRALWIRNESNKTMRTIDEQIIQTLGCVELEIADRSSCPSFTIGYSVLQTKQEIPKVIEFSATDGIIEVGPIDRIAKPFAYVTAGRARFSGNGRWNKNMIYAFRYGLRVLFTSKDMNSGSFLKYLQRVSIRGVFENPEDVAAFVHINGDPCYSDDDEYPMNSWMWNYIRDAIVKINFENTIAALTDKVNDSSETLRSVENEE